MAPSLDLGGLSSGLGCVDAPGITGNAELTSVSVNAVFAHVVERVIVFTAAASSLASAEVRRPPLSPRVLLQPLLLRSPAKEK